MAAKDQIKKPKQTKHPKTTKQNPQTNKKSEKNLMTPAMLRIQESFLEGSQRAKELPADVDKLVVFMKNKQV